MLLGTLTIIVVLIATKRLVGWFIPILASILMVYAYFGPYFPGFLAHSGLSPGYMIPVSYTHLAAVPKIQALLKTTRARNIPVIFTRNVQKDLSFDSFGSKAKRDNAQYVEGHKGDVYKRQVLL